MKQTAIEWLEDKYKKLHIPIPKALFDHAKAMEKEQIIESHFTSSGCNSFDMRTDRINSAYKAAQEYYTETYEQDKQG